MTVKCVAVLGGCFDPIHIGHVALARCFYRLLDPDIFYIVPTGASHYKEQRLQASVVDRVAMIKHAFDVEGISITIDLQEVERAKVTNSYTIDTLRTLRAQLGEHVSIVFLMGADQLQQLNTWHQWQSLFDYAHIGVAMRLGCAFDWANLPSEVSQEFNQRHSTIDKIRNTPCGSIYFEESLMIDLSATQVRHILQQGGMPSRLIPKVVLDYIQQHHLYR